MERLWFQRFADLLLERFSVRRRRASVILADVEATEGNQDGLDKLEAVLDLVKVTDERRYRRIMTQFRAFHLVLLEVYAGQYRHGSRTCQLDRACVMARPLLQTAACIVHETTHGRLRDRGIGYGPEIRSRVERACDREEIRFLERAGADPEMVSHYKSRVGGAAPTDQELVEGGERMLIAHGIPRRIARALSIPERWWLKRHPQAVRPAEEEVRQRRRQAP